jgi:hypothetical protein
LILLEEWNSLGGSITSTTYNKHTKIGYKNTDTRQTKKFIDRQTGKTKKDRPKTDRQTFKLSSTVPYFFCPHLKCLHPVSAQSFSYLGIRMP